MLLQERMAIRELKENGLVQSTLSRSESERRFLPRSEQMKTPVSAEAASPQKNPYDDVPDVKPIIVRLENMPASARTRKHIQDRVRQLNRALDESGTPFRLRLL